MSWRAPSRARWTSAGGLQKFEADCPFVIATNCWALRVESEFASTDATRDKWHVAYVWMICWVSVTLDGDQVSVHLRTQHQPPMLLIVSGVLAPVDVSPDPSTSTSPQHQHPCKHATHIGSGSVRRTSPRAHSNFCRSAPPLPHAAPRRTWLSLRTCLSQCHRGRRLHPQRGVLDEAAKTLLSLEIVPASSSLWCHLAARRIEDSLRRMSVRIAWTSSKRRCLSCRRRCTLSRKDS